MLPCTPNADKPLCLPILTRRRWLTRGIPRADAETVSQSLEHRPRSWRPKLLGICARPPREDEAENCRRGKQFGLTLRRAISLAAVDLTLGTMPVPAAGCVGQCSQDAFLSPQLVEAILQGRQPVALTATRLTELDSAALDWDGAAEKLLGRLNRNSGTDMPRPRALPRPRVVCKRSRNFPEVGLPINARQRERAKGGSCFAAACASLSYLPSHPAEYRRQSGGGFSPIASGFHC